MADNPLFEENHFFVFQVQKPMVQLNHNIVTLSTKYSKFANIDRLIVLLHSIFCLLNFSF